MEKLTPEQIKELTSSDLLSLLYSLYGNASKLGSQWAEAKEEATKLKELLPHKLAVLVSEELKCSPDLGITLAKTLATASCNYKESIEKMVEAEKRARLLEVEYRGCVKSIDALSAISYVRNNELKLGV